ncbi:unnamed protein product [Bemisia tabaci]|uniref:Transformer n=1 Tax=Bemisia tabaci TaxID=7038 RepID=A0A410GM39_BEMTA|nr:transformer [Bemisia tabaci]CAH0387934.1 unnamed protein product [Bemisia tabaci]
MKRSRSRSPLNHPPHSKHNWNANAHKWHAGAVAEEECSSDSRNSSRNSHRRSQGDSNCINIPSSHNTERRRRSGSCDTGDHRPRRSGSFDTSEHRLRRISNRWKWEDRKEELRRIRVVIKRNTVHEPDNSPIDRSVNVEEVVIPRHPGEGSHPIFEREDINANETRTVEHCHRLPRERPLPSRPEDSFHDDRRSDRVHRERVSSSDGDRLSRRVELEPRSSSRDYSKPSTSSHNEPSPSKSSCEGPKDYRRAELEPRPSTSRDYLRPSSHNETSSSKNSRDGHKDYGSSRKKVPKREEEKFHDDLQEREADHHSSNRNRQNHYVEKSERIKSPSPQPKNSIRKSTPKKPEKENGHGVPSPSLSSESDHEGHYESDQRSNPWPGGYRVIERFHPPPPMFRPPMPPPVILPIPPPRVPVIIPRMPYRGPRPPPRPDMFMYPRPPFPGPPGGPRRPHW